MKIRGSIYDHFPISTLARGATINSFFRKEFRTCRSHFRKMIENCTKWSQNEDLGVPIPGIRTKFRSESNGDGPGP